VLPSPVLVGLLVVGLLGGALAGPGGAAVGAAGGLLLAETTVSAVPVGQPESIWGLLGKLVDQAAWLGFVLGGLWLLTWIAPSPRDLFKRAIARWRARRNGVGDPNLEP